MEIEKKLKTEKLALMQLSSGMNAIYWQIITVAMNNVNSVMAPIVDEANLAEEHATLMLEWKEDLKAKLDKLKEKATKRINAIEEYENTIKPIPYSDAA